MTASVLIHGLFSGGCCFKLGSKTYNDDVFTIKFHTNGNKRQDTRAKIYIAQKEDDEILEHTPLLFFFYFMWLVLGHKSKRQDYHKSV